MGCEVLFAHELWALLRALSHPVTQIRYSLADILPSGVCQQRERKLSWLRQRGQTTSRSRLAGAGFKVPSAAAFKEVWW
jgi:hypothetical protein